MENKQGKRRFPWKRLIGYFVIILAAGLAVFGFVANRAYYGSLPADLPCRNCSGEARSIHVDGFDLYYQELGAGMENLPVVILHGGPGHSSLSFKHSFDFLTDQHRVIYYDQRGSGNSQIIPDSTLYTIDQLVEELETIRRDVIGTERMVVIGHSAGGALAQRYALAYGEHVERLILVSSIQVNNGVAVPAVWDRFLPALFMLGGWLPEEPKARDEWFMQLNETSSVSRLSDPNNASFVQDVGYISFATWREVSRSLEGNDYKQQLRQLDVPTLVVYGAADSSFTGEATASGLCDLLPECTLARFEHSGHWPFLEEPTRFAQMVREFLGDQ